jgi:predicted component of type VI protein secretion system
MQEHSATTAELPIPEPAGPPEWLEDARLALTAPGSYLVYREEEAGPTESFRIERGWTRIGRSTTADLRLDDPSVSRRHALIVAEPGKELRVLDDRSLNGVFVNGRALEWGTLCDGDELAVGRFKLYALRS